MNASELPIVLTALGGFLVVLGTGFAWVVRFVDGKIEAERLASTEARTEMRAHLEAEIADLKARVLTLSARESIYLKRVLQLEAFIQGQKGWDMPTLDGWPPR